MMFFSFLHLLFSLGPFSPFSQVAYFVLVVLGEEYNNHTQRKEPFQKPFDNRDPSGLRTGQGNRSHCFPPARKTFSRLGEDSSEKKQ